VVRSDIPTESSVDQIKVWQITPIKSETYKVLYSVKQSIKNNRNKKDKLKSIEATYTIEIYQSNSNDLVIIKNPTISAPPTRANFKTEQKQSDVSITSTTINSITKFLTTFFKVYPNGSANELKYYVKGSVKAINKDYRFAELENPTFHKAGKDIKVDVTVKYLDQTTSLTQYSQYELLLNKDGDN
jgi:hypothetical protein